MLKEVAAVPKIHILSQHVANLIAAGEVVERPASVAKELIENALDAGASAITVEIKNGGISYLRVTDNGCGIARADVKTALSRHATSKIQTEEDLERILTLGFRGEALAAIASVSKIDLLTKTAEEDVGSSLHAEAGEVTILEDAGCPEGTTLIVRNLFYNTPARMKFLKKDTAESAAIEQVIQSAALSNPGVSFQFFRDEKKALHTPGDHDLASSVYAVLGREIAAGMLSTRKTDGAVRVKGYTCQPIASRGNRMLQYFFVNGRPIKSKMLSVALDEAYRDQLMKGRFPVCVLFLELAPELVDVNVHPTKTEVKFAREREVFDAVYFAVKTALSADARHVEATFPEKKEAPVAPPTPTEPKPEFKPIATPVIREEPVAPILRAPIPKWQSAPIAPINVEPEPVAPQIEETVPEQRVETVAIPVAEEYRYIGEILDTYLIVEEKDAVLFIDKHAAHERVLFEQLKAQIRAPHGQVLLTPVALTLSKPEQVILLEHVEALSQIGFVLEEFGDGALAVREVPEGIAPGEISEVLPKLAEGLLAGRRVSTPERLAELLHSVACKAAIKAGKKSDPIEARNLVELVMKNPEIRYCPHGRPVSITMSRTQFEKQFKRIV